MSAAGVLARYAALRRRRREERRREIHATEMFQEAVEQAMLPALVESARSRLPERAGPFHKGTLTLNALSAIGSADARAASRLVDRYRRLIALRQSLGGKK